MTARASSRSSPSTAWAVGALLLLASAGAAGHPAAGRHEHAQQARALLNLTGFVEWPASAFDGPETPFRVCIFGTDQFGERLEAFARQRVGGRPVVVDRVGEGAAAPNCQIAYFASDAGASARSTAFERQGRGHTLTVANDPRFAQRGGMVALVSAEGRVQLHVNLVAIRGSRLKVSAKLLEVAEVRHGSLEPRG